MGSHGRNVRGLNGYFKPACDQKFMHGVHLDGPFAMDKSHLNDDKKIFLSESLAIGLPKRT